MFELKTIWELLRGRLPQELAQLCAYLLAPGLVMGLTFSAVYGRGLSFDLERPISIAELKTEITPQGTAIQRKGVTLILEPVPSEYRIQLGKGTSRIWSSLDEESANANTDRLHLNAGGLSGKTPLIGVKGPVAIVLEGEVGKEIQVPGGTEDLDNWRLTSRRSMSIVSSVLFACVFAFGISLATGIPSAESDQTTGSQVAAKPHKQQIIKRHSV